MCRPNGGMNVLGEIGSSQNVCAEKVTLLFRDMPKLRLVRRLISLQYAIYAFDINTYSLGT